MEKSVLQSTSTTDSRTLDPHDLLSVLTEVKKGNLGVRLPIDKEGLAGKICDTLNDIIEQNERMFSEFGKAAHVIGKQGKLDHRLETPNASGAWTDGIESLNTMISDLVHPTIEIAEVIGEVAKGNLSRRMDLEIGG